VRTPQHALERRKRKQPPRHLFFLSLGHGFCTALAEAGKSSAVTKEAARMADIQTSVRYVNVINEASKKEVEDVFDK
jgi:hypothetical protein